MKMPTQPDGVIIASSKAVTVLSKGRLDLCRPPAGSSGRGRAFLGYQTWFLKFSENSDIPTLATDGQKLYYNPDYVVSCCEGSGNAYEYAPSMVGHEVLHSTLGHCRDWKSKGYPDADRVNAAQDYAINIMLFDMGLKIHKDWLFDEKYRGLTWQQIYKVLPEKHKTTSCHPMPQPGPEKDGKLPDGQKVNAWEKIILEAVRHASTLPGKLPGNLDDLVEEITNPEINYLAVLARFMSRLKKSGMSFVRPNKRYLRSGLVMPTPWSYKAEAIVFIDTSGSVWDKLSNFWGETYGVIRACRCPVKIAQIDTEVRNVTVLKKPDDVKRMHRHGGGGTDFVAAFDWLNKLPARERPDLVIFYTDGYATYPKRAPSWCKVLWIIPGLDSLPANYRPPFGACVKLNCA